MSKSKKPKQRANHESIMTKKFDLIPFIGALLIIGGIMAVIYYAMIFDTSVQVPTTVIFGQTIGGERVNNLGLMNQRSNGILIGIGAAIFGLIVYTVAKNKSKTKKE